MSRTSRTLTTLSRRYHGAGAHKPRSSGRSRIGPHTGSWDSLTWHYRKTGPARLPLASAVSRRMEIDRQYRTITTHAQRSPYGLTCLQCRTSKVRARTSGPGHRRHCRLHVGTMRQDDTLRQMSPTQHDMRPTAGAPPLARTDRIIAVRFVH